MLKFMLSLYQKLCPAQKATLAWKAKCSSSPMNYNVHFHADVSTDGCVTPANQVSYKFDVENVQVCTILNRIVLYEAWGGNPSLAKNNYKTIVKSES